MSEIFGVPVDAAYYVVTALAGALTPLAGVLAVALAIVLFTIAVRLLVLPFSFYALRGQLTQARLAPALRALRERHRRDPERLTREVKALYQANGSGMFAGYLPLLLQWPFLTVMYLLFRSATIDGHANGLLSHHLFGAPLSAHWLSSPGPLSLQGAVFAALFVLLALAGYFSARFNRRLFPSPAPARLPATKPNSKSAVAKRPAATSKRAVATRNTSTSPVTPVAMPSWLTNVLPLVTVVFAAFLPLAGGLYVLTTTAWTLLERQVLARRMQSVPLPPAPAVKAPARAG